MKVELKSEKRTVFGALRVGDSFHHDDKVYIKVEEFRVSDGRHFNTVRLSTGEHVFSTDDDEVHAVNGYKVVPV